MSIIKLYNTLAREKQEFTPLDENRVTLYACGPTVYNYVHIGNGRMFTVFDTLYRVLCHKYGMDHVVYARNITDIDDKIMQQADKEGVTTDKIANFYSDAFQKDMQALGNKKPNYQPRATDYIPQQIKMVETLIAKGHAYQAEGHVLFDVPSYADYGKLSRRSRDEQIAGARVEVAPYKKDPADFVLWKPSSDDQPGWDSPWGRGRPGWHLECSVMSTDILGENFDIHGGGQDLTFPHHENEIAQSCCAHDNSSFAQIWMHNGMLNMDGEKMSKSLGNFKLLHDLLDQYPGEVIRFVLLSAHYRQPAEFNADLLDEAKKTLDRWYSALDKASSKAVEKYVIEDENNFTYLKTKVSKTQLIEIERVESQFIEALYDDLNTPKAFSALYRIFSIVNNTIEGYELDCYVELFKECAQLLGLLQQDPQIWLKGQASEDGLSDDQINDLVDERIEAKDNKDYGRADEIRDILVAEGIILEDSAHGTAWRRK